MSDFDAWLERPYEEAAEQSELAEHAERAGMSVEEYEAANLDLPCTPINGRVPNDLEFRVCVSNDCAVEQWSTWAGMWDLHSHYPTPEAAERFVATSKEN